MNTTSKRASLTSPAKGSPLPRKILENQQSPDPYTQWQVRIPAMINKLLDAKNAHFAQDSRQHWHLPLCEGFSIHSASNPSGKDQRGGNRRNKRRTFSKSKGCPFQQPKNHKMALTSSHSSRVNIEQSNPICNFEA